MYEKLAKPKQFTEERNQKLKEYLNKVFTFFLFFEGDF